MLLRIGVVLQCGPVATDGNRFTAARGKGRGWQPCRGGLPWRRRPLRLGSTRGRGGKSMAPARTRPACPRPTSRPRASAARAAITGNEIAEDYVELIADLIDATGEARAVDLASRLGVTNATVNNAITRLQREGLVHSEPYRSIFLTERRPRPRRALPAPTPDRLSSFLRALGVSEDVARRRCRGHRASCQRGDARCLRSSVAGTRPRRRKRLIGLEERACGSHPRCG